MNKLKILFLVILIVFSFSSCKSVENNIVEQEQTTNTDSDILAGQVTPNYQIIGENKIALSSFNFELPSDLSLLSNTVNPIAENDDGTFQLMIEDKTESIADYNEYINITYSKYKAIGMEMSEIESISPNGLSVTRFSLNTTDEENENVTMIFYFIEQDDWKIDAVVMLKGKKISDYSDIDSYIANINFFENW